MREVKTTEELKFNEKAGFIVALFVAFIALNFYSSAFSNIELYLGPYKYPLMYLFNIMLAALFISVYFFALDYVRTGSMRGWKIFRYFQTLGNIWYAFSLIILPVVFLIHGVSYGINLLTTLPEDYAFIVSAVLGFITGIISMLISVKSGNTITKKQREEEVKRIQIIEEESLKQAEELFKESFYAPALIEMGRVIEIVLQKRLLKEKNIDAKRYNLPQLITLAIKNKLIDSKIENSINEIRVMRNKAAHLDTTFSEKDALWALSETNKILKILDPKEEWN